MKLKQRLEREGLFDKAHKKEIPSNIKRIGVITSREGAVIQDIKNVAWRRNPSVDIVLYNTKVQGNMAENEIAHAIEVLGAYQNIDVIVVARGGGSLEDLWAYNTEIVARATYNCPKPIISAVGHETDFTIIDFVSDLRAPTPSAAAELLTFNLEDKKIELSSLTSRFIKSSSYFIEEREGGLDGDINNLTNLIDKEFIKSENELKTAQQSLLASFERMLNQKYYEIGLFENTLTKINPKSILDKGYARIEQNEQTITSKTQLDTNSDVKIIFKDGQVIANIKED